MKKWWRKEKQVVDEKPIAGRWATPEPTAEQIRAEAKVLQLKPEIELWMQEHWRQYVSVYPSIIGVSFRWNALANGAATEFGLVYVAMHDGKYIIRYPMELDYMTAELEVQLFKSGAITRYLIDERNK